MHKARLESVGLWNVAAEDKEAEKKQSTNPRTRLSETASAAFGKEKVCARCFLNNPIRLMNYSR